MNDAATPPPRRSFLGALGPAIIVASVVLGPGSILTASKVGAAHGYAMIWVLVFAAVMMMGVVALAARLGVTLPGTMCDEIAARFGRPAAVALGLAIFLIIAAFQSSNNIAVVAAIEPLLPADAPTWLPPALLVALNLVIIATLYGFKHLYQPIERLMMVLVALMMIGFAGNLIFARPSIVGILRGLIPSLPADAGPDALWALMGLVATTFSVAGAFYQAYLVREKGWGVAEVKRGLIDSVAGITVLGGITLIIMITSAAVFAGNIDPDSLKNVADVAAQLEPAFGPAAMWLFTLGIFAGAFSSFLVNAMIGGVVFADSLGKGGKMDQPGPKALTVAALVIGAAIAIVSTTTGMSRVALIVFAQALTVLGIPAIALAMAYFALRPARQGEPPMPLYLKIVAVLSVLLTFLLAARTAWSLYLKASG